MYLPAPKLVGIVNVTSDSFSDGGEFLAPERAVDRALELIEDGADIIELGPASSHPDAAEVPAEEEIRRLKPVIQTLVCDGGVPISVDSWKPETQRFAIEQGVSYLNDIEGFANAEIYPDLAASDCLLIAMHSTSERGKAVRVEIEVDQIFDRVADFFATRIEELLAAGIDRGRLVLDPGMGFFLGSNPEPSLEMLRRTGDLADRFNLPVMISVSRKSFLGSVTGLDVDERDAVSLVGELFAVERGAAYIRTHNVRQLTAALKLRRRLVDPTS